MKTSNIKLLTLFIMCCFFLGTRFGFEEPDLDQVSSRMAFRQGNWIAMQADVTVQFKNTEDKNAICRGDIQYHRLDEKIMLKCFNRKNELLFVFKTDDWNFDLYIVGLNTVYSGNIFDLEDSEDIESHLKPLALYRALKVMRFPLSSTKVDNWDDKNVYLNVTTERNGNAFISRRAEMNVEGDITREVYYSSDQRPQITIDRSRYDGYEGFYGQKHFFSHKVSILEHNHEHGENTVTTLAFEDVSFVSELNAHVWRLDVPSNTKRINIRGRFLPVLAGS